MQHKAFEIIEAKADPGDAGTFTALVSVFGNVDHVGDRMMPGSFTRTLNQWRASGDPIPVILSHNWNDPHAHIGVADPHDVEETDRGLVVKGRLDIEDNDVARQVHKLMMRRSLKEFSFGYTVAKGGQRRAKDGANDVLDVDLVEVGPTLKGANPATELHAVKSALGIEEEQPPRDEKTLRRETDEVEREQAAKQLPDVDPEAAAIEVAKDDLAKAEAEVKAAEERAKIRSEKELRRETDRLRRAKTEKQVPEIQEPAGPSLEHQVAALQEQLENAEAEIESLRASETVKAEPELRRETEQVERARVKQELPETRHITDVVAQQADELDALRRELEETRAQLASVEASAQPRDERELRAMSIQEHRKSLGLEPVVEEVKAQTERTEQGLVALERFDHTELAGLEEGLVKAVWSTAYVNDLPDSAFLYVESGSKDSEGKTTPRSKRHFPYKDANGNVDLPHLRNALARIPQSNLPDNIKNQLTARAQRILDNSKTSEPEADKADHRPRSTEDDLRRRSLQTVTDIRLDGVSKRKPPTAVPEEPVKEPLDEAELKRQSRDAMFALLTKGIPNAHEK